LVHDDVVDGAEVRRRRPTLAANWGNKVSVLAGDCLFAEALKLALADREARVLQLRFGLEDGRSRTLEEVGREFSVTRERIRQIEAKALRKLRHPTRSRKLRDFLE